MSLILCRQEPVEHPYYIDILGLHIYSSQELCYVIFHHPVLVMEDFLDRRLFEFIRRDLDMEYLAGRMETLDQTGAKPEEVLSLYLSECDYYSEKEIQKFKQVTGSLRSLPPARYEKKRADYLFSQGQYGRAAIIYEKILESVQPKGEELSFLEAVHGNLGAAYAMMFQFHRALLCYDRAYSIGRSEEILKRIYFLSVFAPELEISEICLSHFTPERRAKWDEEKGKADLEASQAEEVRTLRALFKKDPENCMEGAARLVRRWKKEYRLMV